MRYFIIDEHPQSCTPAYLLRTNLLGTVCVQHEMYNGNFRESFIDIGRNALHIGNPNLGLHREINENEYMAELL